jgi:hypothetical protein
MNPIRLEARRAGASNGTTSTSGSPMMKASPLAAFLLSREGSWRS